MMIYMHVRVHCNIIFCMILALSLDDVARNARTDAVLYYFTPVRRNVRVEQQSGQPPD